MPIKTVRAHSEIIRRVGLGAQQGECPTNRTNYAYQQDDRCEGSSHYGCACERVVCSSAYYLTEEQGKAIQQVLLSGIERYKLSHNESGINRLTKLAKLFD